MEFVDLIVAVHRQFDRAELRHAFGGALALAYIAQPRGTVDIDVNVFIEPEGIERIVDALRPLELEPATTQVTPVAGIRFHHATDPFPVDVFPSLDERYREVERRRVHHPFGRGSDVLPFLSAEDLCVFKLSFGRPQDWVDLRAIAIARPDLDIAYVEAQLVGMRGPTMHPRLARFRSFLRAARDT